ncbi:MAG TPA: DNA polymerase III, partial [Spirochaetia bacterium]|nr:DNA polymerase III [Spirochaetia bacterium]
RNMSEARMTDRVIRAITEHPVAILGHPTGRMIGERDAYRINLSDVFSAAAEAGVALELNANPERLDLDDQAVRAAADAGALIAIGTDAHRTGNLSFMRYGVDTARRGWIGSRSVLNTRSLTGLRKALRGGEHG